MKLPYAKPALPIAAQIAKLESEGMIIADRVAAEHCLQHISYYRLSAYWLPFEHPKTHVGPRFKSGTTFADVMLLYEFDRKLRLLVLDAIERVEVAVRGSWAYQMAMLGGPHEYLNAAHYSDANKYNRNCIRLDEEVNRSKDRFIKHYRHKYSGPSRPPVWMTSEVLSFGQISQWYAAIKDPKLRQAIAKPFDIDETVFVTLVHQLVVIRNTCAHHSRLWDLSLDVTFKLPKKRPINLANAVNRNSPRQIYNALAALQFLLTRAEPPNNWGHRLVTLMATLAAGREAAMGFPANWTNLKLWGGTI